MRRVFIWLARVVVALLLAALVVGVWKRDEIGRLLAVNSLFEADKIVGDAKALDDAGAFAIVIEGVVEPIAIAATEAVSCPTIGIGASARCDGQVLVCNDLLGFDGSFQPRFVKRYAELEQPMVDAVRSYCDEVRDGSFPTPAHAFHRRRGPKKVAKLY